MPPATAARASRRHAPPPHGPGTQRRCRATNPAAGRSSARRIERRSAARTARKSDPTACRYRTRLPRREDRPARPEAALVAGRLSAARVTTTRAPQFRSWWAYDATRSDPTSRITPTRPPLQRPILSVPMTQTSACRAQSGHANRADGCPLSGVKLTSAERRETSAWPLHLQGWRTLAPLSASPHEVGQWHGELYYGRADAPAIRVVWPVAVRPRPALAAAVASWVTSWILDLGDQDRHQTHRKAGNQAHCSLPQVVDICQSCDGQTRRHELARAWTH